MLLDEKTKTLRVGLVGTGYMGRTHANCWLDLPGAELVAIADPTPDSREKAPGEPEQFDHWQEMLDNADVDVVDVCTPTPWHAEAAIGALEKGKSVLCEKPMAFTLDETDAMINAAEKTSGTLMIAHVIRFWPEYAWLKETVDSGKYGALKSFTCLRRMAVPMYNWEMWTHDEKRGGGVPFEAHIHDVDYVRYLMGDPKAVFAVGTRDDTGINQIWASYVFNDERRATSEGSWGYQPSYPFQHSYVAVLDDAVVDFNIHRENHLMLYRPTGDPEPVTITEPNLEVKDEGGNIKSRGGVYNEIAYFSDCVREGRQPAVTTARDARESVRLLLAEIESVNTGEVVPFT
jgi:predicted dehydrogenase